MIRNVLKRIWWKTKLVFARLVYSNASRKMKVVGVTGTNGKTTVVTLLYKLARGLGYKVGLISTIEILINEKKWTPVEGARVPGTTPDSITLAKLFYNL